MGYYSETTKEIRKIIKKYYPEAEPMKDINILHFYLLWMLDKIDVEKDLIKASRWMGWVLAKIDQPESLNLISNQESRDLIRKDVHNADDIACK